MPNPVLEAARLRVDIEGLPEVDGLSFQTTGERILMLAGPRALFQAAAGWIGVRHGELRTAGLSPMVALRKGLVAAAPADAPLPPSWKARQYIVWSSRLAGHAKREAESLALDAIGQLKLEAVADRDLRYVPLHVRRAVTVGAALATGATTLLIEDPLRGMTEEAARTFARLLVRATSGLRTVIFSARTSLASPLAIDADEALILDGKDVVAQGAPAEVAARDRSYAVRIHGGGANFARLIEARGARISGQGSLWTVDLGEGLQAKDLLEIAAASATTILELRPLTYAFA